MNVKPFKIKHLKDMSLKREAYKEYFMPHIEDGIVYELSQGAEVVTILDEKFVYGVLGLREIWPGVADAWAVLGEQVQEHPIGFHRLVLSVIAHYERELNLHRIQISVREEYKAGRKWAQKLGFEEEGLMKAYTSDKINYYRFGRTRPWTR